SVFTVRTTMPLSSLLIVTTAPETPPPLVSSTVPVIVALILCASALLPINSPNNAIRHTTTRDSFIPPSRLFLDRVQNFYRADFSSSSCPCTYSSFNRIDPQLLSQLQFPLPHTSSYIRLLSRLTILYRSPRYTDFTNSTGCPLFRYAVRVNKKT